MKFNLRLILILFFIISTGLQNFGAGFYWFAIPFGGIKITDGLLVFFILTLDAILNRRKSVNWRDSTIFPLFLLIVFLIFQMFKNIFIDQMSFIEILKRAPQFICLFFIIPLAYQIHTKQQLHKYVVSLLVIGSISNIIGFVQFFSPYLWGNKLLVDSGIVRPDNPAILFSVFSLFYSLSFIYSNKSHKKVHFLYYILAWSSIIVVFLTLGRGIIFATIVGILVLILSKNKIESGTMLRLKSVKIVLFLFFVLFLFVQFTNYNADVFIGRIQQGIQEYNMSGTKGSVGFRKEMITVKILKILNEDPIIGRGWNFTFDKGIKMGTKAYYENYFDPYSLNGDSTWQNVFILFGTIGVLIFIYFFISYFKNSYEIAKKTKDYFYYNLSISIIPIPIFIFFHSFASSYFNTTGLIFLVVMSVLLYDLKHLNYKSLNKI